MSMNRDRIIVQQLHGHWSAWWEHEPQIAFRGATPAEAVDRAGGVCRVVRLKHDGCGLQESTSDYHTSTTTPRNWMNSRSNCERN